jgi:hypothetical protein
MYNKYLEIKETKNGKGTFTTVEIVANEPIIEFTGPLVYRKHIKDPAMYLQVGHDKFIGPSGAMDDYFNHSCEPNCLVHIVGNRAILYSLYVILAGTELTFDYSTTSNDTLDSWSMVCNCSSHKCRKNISGYQYLNDEIKQEYLKKNMVPLFIMNPNLFQKR